LFEKENLHQEKLAEAKGFKDRTKNVLEGSEVWSPF
jgi:hypothetical protein